MRIGPLPSLNPPRLRTIAGEAHRTATWLELFYDLAFVVAVAVLGGRLFAAHDVSGVLSYLGYFLMLWWLWASHTFYADRYDTDDFVYRLLATVQLVAVAVIATSLSSGPAASTAAFAVGYTVARIALLAQYLRARRHVPETRLLVTGYLAGFGIGAALWAVSIFTPTPARFGLWAAAMVVDLATPWLMRREQARAPLDVSHLPERFGLFTILVLGESIAASVVGLSGHQWTSASVFIGILAVLTATVVWWLYFDNVEGLVVRRDPERARTWRPTVWIYSHLGLAAGLGMTAIGLEHAIVSAGSETLDGFETWLLVSGVALTLICLALAHLASGDETTSRLHDRVAISRSVAAVAALLVGLFEMSPAGVVLAMVAVLLATAGSRVSDRRSMASSPSE